MRRAHIVTIVCLLISAVLAAAFAVNYEGGSLATSMAISDGTPIVQKIEMSPAAIERGNLIGIGVILGAVIIIAALAFYRKPNPATESAQATQK